MLHDRPATENATELERLLSLFLSLCSAILGLSWEHFGALLGLLGLTWNHVVVILRKALQHDNPQTENATDFGTFSVAFSVALFGPLGALLGASWGNLGATLGPSWASEASARIILGLS